MSSVLKMGRANKIYIRTPPTKIFKLDNFDVDVSGSGVEVEVDVDLDVGEMTFQRFTLVVCILKKVINVASFCGTLAACNCLGLIL